MITIFNLSNGQIVKNLHCANEDDIPLNYNSLTEGYIDGEYAGNKYYIENKNPVLIPDAPNTYSRFDFVTKQWFDLRTPETQWALVKNRRNQLLLFSDWTDTLSAKSRLGDSLYEQWQTYRQALRDITTQADPFNIVWPVPPGG